MSEPKGTPPNPGVFSEVAGVVGSNPDKMSNADKALANADLKWQRDLDALRKVATTPFAAYPWQENLQGA